MNALTLNGISDELQRKLAERASANHRTPEQEAVFVLQMTIERDEAILASIPGERWQEIEESLVESMSDPGTPLTKADMDRYREMARGYQTR